MGKTIVDINMCQLDLKIISPIRVVKVDDQLITLDNCRLFILQNVTATKIPVFILDSYFKPLKCLEITSVNIVPCNCSNCEDLLHLFPRLQKQGSFNIQKQVNKKENVNKNNIPYVPINKNNPL